ncbi:tail fiber protein [Haemophilus influenzae]|nr:tail fiber protein [Haemophilus influenzae]MCK9107224.1 tail fiber protein [Haemophilus influenzae]
MALVNKPDESIFASSAKQGEVDNFPDLLRGWGITFDQTQGIPPMEWFNFLFKRLDEKHTYLMQRGLPEWSATQDYTKGSCVQFDGVSYRALKKSKNNRPNESESQYWVRWGFTLSEIAQATLTQYGVTQLYTGYDSQSEDLALTPKTGYQLKQLIDSNTRALGNVIPNSKKSSAVNSNSADTVATSAAVKTAYDKAVEAEELANTKWTAKSATETEPGILPISHKTDGADKNKFASEYAVGEAAKKGLPLGAVVSFPRAVTNPVGFLKADGTTFNQQTFPDLYRTLGDSNQLPDLTRSDTGMTAYFAVDNIPAGWIAFDSIRTTVTQQNYPELYRHLVGKYGSISNVPLAEDRFIRNTGNGLNIGQTQSDEIKKHVHRVRTHWADSSDSSIFYDKTKTVIDSRLRTATTTDDNLSDNGFMHPLLDSPMATGGAETRPRAIALKLCIKAKNTFDDVQFWVKAFGVVENAGALDAGTLAQNMQALSARVEQKIEENKQSTLREINNAKVDINQQFLQAKQDLSQIGTLKKVWEGNVNSGQITLSEKCFGKTLIFYLRLSEESNYDPNTTELVSFEVGAEDTGGGRLTSIREVIYNDLYRNTIPKEFTVYIAGDGKTINIGQIDNRYIKRIYIR